jgi:hypothetical protein
MMEAEPLDPPLDYIRSMMGQEDEMTWGRQIAGLQRLEVLQIEFETESKKKNQLDVVVDRAKRWKFPRKDGTHLRWAGEMSETTWQGLAHPVRDHGEDLGEEDNDDEELNEENADEEVVFTDVQGEAPVAEDQADPPKLTYVVAALTFRLVKS